MTEFTIVAKASDIQPGDRKRVELNGERVSIFNIEGEFFAIYDTCPHKKTAPLIRGTLNELGIKCPNHGYRFDLKTGKCDRGDRWNTKVFPIKIEDDNILLGPSTHFEN
ncbi:MAG: Rieske 2Fe-2S domain-containing protein [Nitrospina sp.]|jgi:nitrite reductase/ring-hydroxylating ferredoxin subunit|nr:Rieske 2Fe-2S domain-containing protein [Nitrospina sp.]